MDAYESWQRKMGRDINPTELVYRVRAAGAKRVKLAAPADIVIEKTQLPKRNTRTVTYGGLRMIKVCVKPALQTAFRGCWRDRNG